jgi:hypothetical protein
VRSPFADAKYRSWLERFVPGIADHSMQEYSRILKIACAHCAFLRETIERMRKQPELQMRKESELIKAAEQAWKRLRAEADPVAWDAKRKLESSVWLDTWHAEISKRRDQAIDNALSSLRRLNVTDLSLIAEPAGFRPNYYRN